MQNRKQFVFFLKNSRTFLIALLALGLCLSACNTKSPVAPTPTANIPTVVYIGEGVAIGIKEFKDSPFWLTYKTPANTNFSGFLGLLNQKSADTYLLSCLVDYQQQPCKFDDKETTLLYSIDMARNESRDIKFELPQLANGFHDFAILAFANPDNHDLSDQYRLSTDLDYFYSGRAVLLVGDPPYASPLMEFKTGEPRNYTESQLNGVLINTIPDSAILPGWFSQQVKPGETIDYYIHVANDTEPDRTYAAISFLDFQQIPISENQLINYVSLNTGERVEIASQVTIPQAEGVHELMVLLVPRPFEFLEDPHEGNQRLLLGELSYTIQNSIRVGLYSQDKNQ